MAGGVVRAREEMGTKADSVVTGGDPFFRPLPTAMSSSRLLAVARSASVDTARIAAVSLIADLPAAELDELAAAVSEVEVEAGAEVISLDNYGTAVYFIEQGRADVLPAGGEATQILGPGDTFGEIALLLTGERTASIVARTPMRLLSLSGQDFERIRAHVPELERSLRRLGVERAGRASLVPQAGPPPASVPDPIRVPDGSEVFLIGHAVGVQIYSCTGTGWSFVAPKANLFDDQGELIVTHFAGPTWQTKDGSMVVGHAEASVSVDPTAISWVRLSAASTTPGQLGDTTIIQRVATTGGLAPPAADCNAERAGTVAEVPYTADYYFWK